MYLRMVGALMLMGNFLDIKLCSSTVVREVLCLSDSKIAKLSETIFLSSHKTMIRSLRLTDDSA